MSLDMHITHVQGNFTLDAKIKTGAGITAIFGHSGAGKTTLINAVAGLLTPQSGHVHLDGTALFDSASGLCVPPHKRQMGYVFQDARLFAHMNVRKNLSYGARFAKSAPTGGQPGFDNVVDLLGLGGLLDRGPTDLSGGEKQRVALGRALLSRPRMLLMDEPLAALDSTHKDLILPYLEGLKSGPFDIPILYVSHALDEVARLADTLVILSQGKVAANGPLFEVMSDPDVVPLLGVRQAGAVLHATVTAHKPSGISTLRVSAGELNLPGVQAPVGTRVRLRILAQDVILSRTQPKGLSSSNILPVTVQNIRDGAGPGAALALSSGTDQLLARVSADAVNTLQLEVGVQCFALINATSVAPESIGR